MKKKGTVVLLIISVAFLFAIVLFFTSLGDSKPGDAVYLGETEIEVYKLYQTAEEYVTYVERSAQLSLERAILSDNFEEEFEVYFNDYLARANQLYGQELGIENYDVTFNSGEIIAKSDKMVDFINDAVTYSIYPNFKLVYVAPVTIPDPVYVA